MRIIQKVFYNFAPNIQETNKKRYDESTRKSIKLVL